MEIHGSPATYKDVESMRDLYRHELNCQIIRDSFLRRGLADPYLLHVNGRIGGYGAISNKYDKGRLMEFYVLPHLRGIALPMFRELLRSSLATHVEAQTNSPLMLMMLYDCARNITAENYLFADALLTQLPCPRGVFRAATADDRAAGVEPDWLIEADHAVVATGGFLCHYNPPFGDVYMEVAEAARRQGLGSYLVQELKRVCYEAGKKPAARCNADNPASRRTLEKAGFIVCGRMMVGEVVADG